jgi:hypothetical protein
MNSGLKKTVLSKRSGAIALSVALVFMFLLPILVIPGDTQAKVKDPASPREGSATLLIRNSDDTPLVNASVSFSQVSHDFLFGTGTTHPTGVIPLTAFQSLRDIGVNFALPYFAWYVTEPNPRQYEWQWNGLEYSYHINELNTYGFVLDATSFIFLMDAWYNMPEYMRGIGYQEFYNRAYTHTFDIVTHYKDIIDMWTINEPTYQNMYNFTEDQMVELIGMLTQTIYQVDPDAQIMINMVPADDPGINYYPIAFLQRLVNEGIGFDIVGMELYPDLAPQLDSNGYPDLAWTSARLDAFSGIGKPVLLSEIGIPQTHTIEAQSQWIRDVYTLAFNKPYVLGVVWLFVIDDPFLPGAGLMNDDYTPRPAFYTLKNLIAAWTSTGSTRADIVGAAEISGYAGDYQVLISSPGCSFSATIHIHEGERLTTTLKSPQLCPHINYSLIFLPLVLRSY